MSDQALDQLSATVPRTYGEAVRALAAAHATGSDRVDIYHVPDPDGRIVRLIEVSDAFPEGAVERVAPLGGMERVVPVFPMGPARDFPFRSEIVQVKPVEWEDLRRGGLKLNRDWGDLNHAAQVSNGH